MSVTVDSNGVTLTGDGYGVNWARKQLAAAPATAVKMQFVYRAYWLDSADLTKIWTAKGWDPCFFLGLGFTNTIYDFSAGNTIAPTDFFGVLTTGVPYDGGSSPVADTKHYGIVYNVSQATYFGNPSALTGTAYTQNCARMNGIGGKYDEASVGTGITNSSVLMRFPSNATRGARVTVMAEVWGSALNKTVYMRYCTDFGSLAEGDAMFTAMDGKSLGTGMLDILENTIHGDVTSNWRNSNGTMNFPRWLKIKCPLPEYSLRLKYFKVRYLDASNTVL